MLNSFVDLLNNGTNADCFCMISNFDEEDEAAEEQDRINYKNGKAGDEKAAEAYVRNHAVIITDLQGNVEFDLLDQMAYSLPKLDLIDYREKYSSMKRFINNYFINYFKMINGEMSSERFNKKVARLLKR